MVVEKGGAYQSLVATQKQNMQHRVAICIMCAPKSTQLITEICSLIIVWCSTLVTDSHTGLGHMACCLRTWWVVSGLKFASSWPLPCKIHSNKHTLCFRAKYFAISMFESHPLTLHFVKRYKKINLWNDVSFSKCLSIKTGETKQIYLSLCLRWL